MRFGNVVGSRGSVVPISFARFRRRSGPITHEEMTRYFMTIPEAVQLVIQATTLASKGDVYMLDMGNPLKIIDLARKLIVMSGLRPDKDIEIKIVGSRPGEKIHEQLWYDDALVATTRFPRVLSVESSVEGIPLKDQLEFLAQATREHDEDEVRSMLQRFSAPLQHLPGAGGQRFRLSQHHSDSTQLTPSVNDRNDYRNASSAGRGTSKAPRCHVSHRGNRSPTRRVRKTAPRWPGCEG